MKPTKVFAHKWYVGTVMEGYFFGKRKWWRSTGSNNIIMYMSKRKKVAALLVYRNTDGNRDIAMRQRAKTWLLGGKS